MEGRFLTEAEFPPYSACGVWEGICGFGLRRAEAVGTFGSFMRLRVTAVRPLWPLFALTALGLVVFHLFGNSTFGYIATRSVAAWWTFQWVNEASETEHGLLLLPLALWLFWRNARAGAPALADGKAAEDERPPLDVMVLVGLGLAALFAAGMAGESPALPGVHAANAILLAAMLMLAVRVRERELAEGQVPVGCQGWALAGIVTGIGLTAIGYGAQQSRFGIIGMILFVLGVLAAVGGRRWARAGMAPAFLLLFAIPLATLTDYVGLPMRMMVTRTAELFAGVVGIDVIRTGSQLVSVDGRFQYDVAPACSGIRSLMALSALSFIVGYFSFRAYWRRGLLLALALPYAFAGNVVRICAIVLAGHWFGQGAGAKVHDYSGFVIFLAVVALALTTVTLLQKFLPEKPREPAPSPEWAGPDARPPWAAIAVTAALAIFVVAAGTRFDRHQVDGLSGVKLAANGIDPVPLPPALNFEWMGFPAEVSQVEREVLPPDTGFSRRIYENMQGRRVFVSIVQSGADRSSIHQAELCLEGQGWSIIERRRHAFTVPVLQDSRLPVQLLRIETRQRTRDGGTVVVPALFAYWFVGGDRVIAANQERVMVDFWDRLVRFRGNRWGYVFVQTEATDGEQAALARLEEVLNLSLPHFQTAGRVDLTGSP